MKALRFLGNGRAEVANVPMPKPEQGCILVKILASAVCGSERKDWLGTIPNDVLFISGHEAVGEVSDANGSSLWKNGDRVCVQIMNGCGVCHYCKSGLPTFCPQLQYEGRCHAQYVALPESCVVKMDDDIPPETAVLLGGDLLGVAWRAGKQLPIRKDKWVYISGGGPIGLGVMFLLKHLGARIVLSEPSAFRRDYALRHAGADLAYDPSKVNVLNYLQDLTGGIGPEITIECSGNPLAQKQALDWTRCGGHVMFCGENYSGLTIIPSLQIIHKELNVHGAFYFSPADVPEILSLYRNGMDPSSLVSHTVLMEEAPAALEEFFAGKTGKVVIFPND